VQWLDQCTGMRATAVIARQAYYEKAPRDLESRGASAAPMRAAGFEPTTSCSGGKRSIQLSYARSQDTRATLPSRALLLNG
jgi:hypothetical protein